MGVGFLFRRFYVFGCSTYIIGEFVGFLKGLLRVRRVLLLFFGVSLVEIVSSR